MAAAAAAAAGRGKKVRVVDVWADNQEAELTRIRGLVREFKIAAVATCHDVPPIRPSPRTLEACYDAVRSRVERVRFAQLGLALANREGELALGGCVWRFHLGEPMDERFLAGVGVEPARRRPADPRRVCGALRDCSRATMPNGVWVTSDGAEDVAYLVRHINGGSLPRRRDEFLRACGTSFPALYDLRVLAEWTTVTGAKPPLADYAGPEAFARFVSLAREWQFGERMMGYTGFLYGLGAVDDYCLLSHKRTAAEWMEKERRMMELFAEVCDEDYLRRIVLG